MLDFSVGTSRTPACSVLGLAEATALGDGDQATDRCLMEGG